jgi:4-amino-4-deoxy-L-arabinose transferase-like glycosyltransferase
VGWPPSRTALIATALLVAALAVRVAEVELTSYRPIHDAGSYLTLASEVAHAGDYSTSDRSGGGAGGTRGPTAYFGPGYPYFLAGVDVLDGQETRRGRAVYPARLAQTVLGTVTVGLVGLVALELFGSAAALAALAIAAFYPVLVELSGALVAENLMTALMLAALWATLRARRSASRRAAWIAAAGVLTGLATLTHENAALIAIPLAFGVWTARPRGSLEALAAPALLIAMAAVTIAPWTIRNAIVLHRFIPVSDETGITLVGTYNRASAADRQIPYKWRIYYSIPGERSLIRESGHMSEPALGNRLLNQAFGYIGHHPLAPLAVAYHNTRRMLELAGTFAWRASTEAMSLPRGLADAGVVSFWILALVAAAGSLTAAARRAPRWIWAIPALLALSVVLVNVETPRFREPVDPFLILLAACAVVAAARAFASPRAAAMGRATAAGWTAPRASRR